MCGTHKVREDCIYIYIYVATQSPRMKDVLDSTSYLLNRRAMVLNVSVIFTLQQRTIQCDAMIWLTNNNNHLCHSLVPGKVHVYTCL